MPLDMGPSELKSGAPIQKAWRIKGRVQGVGFRWWCVRTGVGLGLVGNVRNEADGGVVLCVAGSQQALAKMEEALAVGPLMARVASVEGVVPEGPFPVAGIEVLG